MSKPKSQIDFLESARIRSKQSFRIFAVGAVFLLLLALAPNYFSRSVFESKRILGTATTGFELLRSGEFRGALESFTEAQSALQTSQNILTKLLDVFPSGLDPANLLQAGTLIGQAAEWLRLGFNEFSEAKIIWDEATNSSNQNLYLGLKGSHEKLVQASENLQRASSLIAAVGPNVLPQEYRSTFLDAQSKLELAAEGALGLIELQNLLLGFLGGEPKTYALVFQNNNEMRATGGFIGTYGIINFANGTAQLERIESIYNLDGQLKELIAAPGPLRRQQTQYWGMRDSNWFVDFSASARKILEFLEKEGGILADGVIAITPNIFEELLKITGPIEMQEYGETLTAQNFRAVVQYKTSLDYDAALNQPKKLLADFAPKFLVKLQDLTPADWLSIMNVLYTAVAEKQLLAFSINSAHEKQFENLGADGKIKLTDGDFLAVFHSNVGGGKTDQDILQKIEKKVSIDSGGLAITRLKITRTHNGFNEQFFPKNLDFMRILVPRQAKLLSASGFDNFELLPSSFEGATVDLDLQAWDQTISHDSNTGMYTGLESGYKFFANFLELLPGESRTVELTYEVQFGSAKSYTQILQKQPGGAPFELSFEINYLGGDIAYYHPQTFTKEGSRLNLSETVNTDRFFGVIGQ